MQPLEPGLSFIAQRYMNHVDVHLSRFIHAFQSRSNRERDVCKQYYQLLSKNLAVFQRDIPIERRVVLHLGEPEKDTLKLLSVYRNPVPNELVSIQLERNPPPSYSQSSCLGGPKALQRALDEHPELSLTCLLNPVQGLMADLKEAGWKTTIDFSPASTEGETVMICLSDGTVAVHFIINIHQFQAETAAIKEYHANKDKVDD